MNLIRFSPNSNPNGIHNGSHVIPEKGIYTPHNDLQHPGMQRRHFVGMMQALKKQYEHDAKCADALEVVFSGDSNFYDNHHITSQVVIYLKEIMRDMEDSLIEYFMFETSFGQDVEFAKVKDANDLYDQLCRLHIVK